VGKYLEFGRKIKHIPLKLFNKNLTISDHLKPNINLNVFIDLERKYFPLALNTLTLSACLTN
jgi:hypothetical protein